MSVPKTSADVPGRVGVCSPPDIEPNQYYLMRSPDGDACPIFICRVLEKLIRADGTHMVRCEDWTLKKVRRGIPANAIEGQYVPHLQAGTELPLRDQLSGNFQCQVKVNVEREPPSLTIHPSARDLAYYWFFRYENSPDAQMHVSESTHLRGGLFKDVVGQEPKRRKIAKLTPEAQKTANTKRADTIRKKQELSGGVGGVAPSGRCCTCRTTNGGACRGCACVLAQRCCTNCLCGDEGRCNNRHKNNETVKATENSTGTLEEKNGESEDKGKNEQEEKKKKDRETTGAKEKKDRETTGAKDKKKKALGTRKKRKNEQEEEVELLEIPKFKRNETLAIVCEMDGMLQLAGTCKLVSSEPWKKGLSLPDGSPLGTLYLSILFYTLLANSFCV